MEYFKALFRLIEGIRVRKRSVIMVLTFFFIRKSKKQQIPLND